MSIDEATPEDWDTVTALNNLSIRKPKKVDPVDNLTTTTKEQSKPSKQLKRPCLNTSSKVISRVTH